MTTLSPRPTELHQKRSFYRQPVVVAEYEQRRFGGASGAWVNEREIDHVLRMLPATGRVLDLGCGTGRLSRRLVAKGHEVVLLDASDAMLARAVPSVGAPAVLADAFALPFSPASFDVVVGLRVAFHFADLDRLVASVASVLKPGGHFIVDTYRWTPRAVFAVARRQWGGKVHLHSGSAVDGAAKRAGLRRVAHSSCFLFSPYLYRLLPMMAVRALVRVEEHLPEAARVREFWSLESPGGLISCIDDSSSPD